MSDPRIPPAGDDARRRLARTDRLRTRQLKQVRQRLQSRAAGVLHRRAPGER